MLINAAYNSYTGMVKMSIKYWWYRYFTDDSTVIDFKKIVEIVRDKNNLAHFTALHCTRDFTALHAGLHCTARGTALHCTRDCTALHWSIDFDREVQSREQCNAVRNACSAVKRTKLFFQLLYFVNGQFLFCIRRCIYCNLIKIGPSCKSTT